MFLQPFACVSACPFRSALLFSFVCPSALPCRVPIPFCSSLSPPFPAPSFHPFCPFSLSSFCVFVVCLYNILLMCVPPLFFCLSRIAKIFVFSWKKSPYCFVVVLEVCTFASAFAQNLAARMSGEEIFDRMWQQRKNKAAPVLACACFFSRIGRVPAGHVDSGPDRQTWRRLILCDAVRYFTMESLILAQDER